MEYKVIEIPMGVGAATLIQNSLEIGSKDGWKLKQVVQNDPMGKFIIILERG